QITLTFFLHPVDGYDVNRPVNNTALCSCHKAVLFGRCVGDEEHSDRGLLDVQGGLSIRRPGAPHHHIHKTLPSQEISSVLSCFPIHECCAPGNLVVGG